jgi:hypothetical protein
MRASLKEGELREKRERQRLKEQRDYEIFDQMPYRYNTKAFTLRERHPVGRLRFEAATSFIRENCKSSAVHEKESSRLLEQVRSLWEDKQSKRLWIVPGIH